jgi:hypothetical protein
MPYCYGTGDGAGKNSGTALKVGQVGVWKYLKEDCTEDLTQDQIAGTGYTFLVIERNEASKIELRKMWYIGQALGGGESQALRTETDKQRHSLPDLELGFIITELYPNLALL